MFRSQLGCNKNSCDQTRSHVQILFFPKMDKRQSHSRSDQSPLLHLSNAKEQNQLVWSANKLRNIQILSQKFNLRACFELHHFSEKTPFFLSPKTSITFIINKGRYSMKFPSFPSQNHPASKPNFTIENKVSHFEF